MKQKISFRVDTEVLAKVQRIAEKNNTTVNAIVREYLEDLARTDGRVITGRERKS